MLVTRSGINNIVFGLYSKIITIATRYSLLRTQFKDNKGQEIPVLDYQTQQAKVISRIGQVYAFMFTCKSINELSDFVFQEASKGRFDRLNEAHTLTSATKAYITFEALNNSEVARRSAGGHGFHMYSGMVGAQHEISTCVTLEGISYLIQDNLLYCCSKQLDSCSSLWQECKKERNWTRVSSIFRSWPRENSPWRSQRTILTVHSL